MGGRTQPRIGIGFALALALCACRPSVPESLDHAHVELCCKTANPDNLSFSGCRAAPVSAGRGRDGLMCRARETIWVRGPVSCTSGVERECRLSLDADAREQQPAEPEPKPEPAPAPAPIVPMPLDPPDPDQGAE